MTFISIPSSSLVGLSHSNVVVIIEEQLLEENKHDLVIIILFKIQTSLASHDDPNTHLVQQPVQFFYVKFKYLYFHLKKVPTFRTRYNVHYQGKH